MTANDVPAAAVRLVAVKDGDRGGGAPTHEHTLQAASSCSGEGTWQVQIARELASNPMPLPPPPAMASFICHRPLHTLHSLSNQTSLSQVPGN